MTHLSGFDITSLNKEARTSLSSLRNLGQRKLSGDAFLQPGIP